MPGPVWATVSGLCATLTGVGLARFAYTPLLPALVAQGWFTPGQAAFMAAANLAGYLGGALTAPACAARLRPDGALRGAGLLAAAAFLGCAVPLSPSWFALWRFLAGVAGGVLMVLAAPTVLPYIPAGRRGLAGGVMFTGVGLGIAVSGLLIPPLLRLGLPMTWVVLALAALGLTITAWKGWPPQDAAPPVAARLPRAVILPLAALYALDAIALVPHMLFLSDWVARGRGLGVAAGAAAWAAFGGGALLGAGMLGRLGDRLGFRMALRVALLVQGLAIALATLPLGWPGILATSAITGAFVPGIPPLVLGRAAELLGNPAAQRAAWRLCTVAFAIGQAASAYAYSGLFAWTGRHAPLFVVGAAASLLAVLVDLATAARPRAPVGAS